MPKRYVFIPFERTVQAMTVNPSNKVPDLATENQLRSAYHKQARSEWKLLEKRQYFVKSKKPGALERIKDGSIIYVQAHGYSGDGKLIGGDNRIGAIDAEQLVEMMVNSCGLPKDTKNLQIKVWACFSGFDFAEAFYDKMVEKFGQYFLGLKVYGYTGQTRIVNEEDYSKSVFQWVDDDGEPLPPWIATADSPTREGKAKNARVEYGPHTVRRF